ncbi:MAG: hypothetical protein WD059_10710 [Balneolaceae bacterium]
MDRKNGKKIITILLTLSCIISGIILAATPSPAIHKIQTVKELDSLITTHILNSQVNPQQVRVRDITVDSTFTRRMYRIRVPSRFSKTLFHLELHKNFRQYKMEVPAKVSFPERDMDIYLYNEGTVLRTIRLITDTDLDTMIIGVH